jgi:membrane associated rhomboid family serine protease
MWPAGLIAFAVAGPHRATAAIGYGILFAGLAQLKFGESGTIYVGSSSIVFALFGVIILASIRKGIILTTLMVLGIGFLGDSFFNTIRPTEVTAIMGISWLGHLGGLIGGFAADLKDPVEAIRVLHKSETIDDSEAEALLKRAYPEGYQDERNEEFENEILEEVEKTIHDRAKSEQG